MTIRFPRFKRTARTVEGAEFHNTRVLLDNVYHVGCEFHECTMVYRGGDHMHLVGNYIEGCRWYFEGPAACTVKFLSELYQDFPELTEQIFDRIRAGHPFEPPTTEPAE